MKNPFRKSKTVSNTDTDPIYITHAEDSSLDDDEMIIHTTIDPTSIKKDAK